MGVRQAWALGDYHRFASDLVWPLGAELASACQIRPADRVLDVAAGSGNVALRAAEAGAIVVASDLTPQNLAAGAG
jgi:2-polyprenyl-3-methyl-5-hydroxy-6-metoxy-1,4-benzoquinol methylase